MLSNIIGFVWDKGNREKCQKHGVSIQETEDLFKNKHILVADLKHSFKEERFLAIGKSSTNRYIFAAFTLLENEDGKKIRPISVRYMHQKEIDRYEQEITTHF